MESKWRQNVLDLGYAGMGIQLISSAPKLSGFYLTDYRFLPVTFAGLAAPLSDVNPMAPIAGILKPGGGASHFPYGFPAEPDSV